jgi:hypothetical protein
MPKEFMAAEDVLKFGNFAERISGIYAGCIHRLGYTTEAINFFQEFTPLAGDNLVTRVLK